MSTILSRSPEALSLFAEEARVGAELRHPNIVQLLDYAHDEQGEPYLVSELVEGIHLGDWVLAHARAGEETPWELVAAMGLEVLRGLDAAHSRLDARLASRRRPEHLARQKASVDFGSRAPWIGAHDAPRHRQRRQRTCSEIVRGSRRARKRPSASHVLWEALSGRSSTANE
jgi:serine/threonine protein kinase